MKNTNKYSAKALVDLWYNRTGEFITPQRYLSRAGKVVEIVRLALREHGRLDSYKNIRVQVSKTPDPCVISHDDGRWEINLPAWLFTLEHEIHPQLGGYDETAPQNTALTFLNGAAVHETVHTVLSPHDNRVFFEGLETDDLSWDALFYCISLIEDLYINHQHELRGGVTDDWLQGLVRVSCTEDKLDDEPDEKTIDDWFRLLFQYRNPDLRDHQFFAENPDFKACLDRALSYDPIDYQARGQIAYDLYHLLKIEVGESQGGEDPMQPQTADDESTDPNGFGDLLQELDWGELVKHLDPQLIEEINDEIKMASRQHDKSYRKADQLKPVLVPLPKARVEELKPSKHFRDLGATIRFQMGLRQENSLPLKKGDYLTPESIKAGIAYDTWFVRELHSRKVRLQPEVIFIVDRSGSMADIMYLVAQAAYGAFRSLVQAGVPTTVVAHTTDSSYGRKSPIYSVVGSWRMPLGANIRKPQLWTDLAYSAGWNNADGLILREMRNHFGGDDRQKNIIFLADGLPTYGEVDPYQELREEIQISRKQGIKVYSFALEDGLAENLADLFGAEYTVDMSDHDYLSSSMRHQIQKIVLEY